MLIRHHAIGEEIRTETEEEMTVTADGETETGKAAEETVTVVIAMVQAALYPKEVPQINRTGILMEPELPIL
jgi:hypothetical protein